MLLWTAASGVVLYWFEGKYSLSLLGWCVAFGFVSGQLGQRGVNHVLQKTGRPSYVIFLLGFIIAVSDILIATFSIILMAKGKEEMGFDISGFLCTPSTSNK